MGMRTTTRLIVAVGLLMLLSAGIAGVSAAETSVAQEEELTCEFPVEMEDVSGETVTLDEEPDEVVVLAASGAQYMWYMNAEHKVTGVPDFHATQYIEGLDERTNVVDEMGSPINEEVVALDPDLVYAPSVVSDEDVEELRDAGLTVYHEEMKISIEDTYAVLERLGQLVGECEAAAETVEDMQGAFDEFDRVFADEEPVSVFYSLDPETGWTAGAGTVEDQLITIAGGENIAADEYDSYAEISEEDVVDADPEWLVIGENRELPPEAEDTTAVQEDQIVRVNPNFISQHGPVLTEPTADMAEQFHPEAYEELDQNLIRLIDDDTFTTEPLEDTDDTTDETDDVDDTADADDDGAGLTVVTAAVALSLVAFIARKR